MRPFDNTKGLTPLLLSISLGFDGISSAAATALDDLENKYPGMKLIFQQALASDPGARYQNPLDFVAALEAVFPLDRERIKKVKPIETPASFANFAAQIK